MFVGTAGFALPGGEAMRRDMTVYQALRHPNVRFSTTWAQNQPLAQNEGHGLQFDLSAVKKERRGRIPFSYWCMAWPVRAQFSAIDYYRK